MISYSQEGIDSLRRHLLQPRFWWNIRGILAAALLGILPVWLFAPLTHPDGLGAFKHLSTVILLIAVWGFVEAVRSSTRIEVDEIIAHNVRSRSISFREKLSSKALARVELNSLSDWLPRQVHWRLGMVRLLTLIVEEARERKYHAPSILTQPFRERSLSAVLRLRALQRIALQLGILGTFLGLLRAISTFSERGIENPGFVSSLMESLHLAFGTSIAGLEVSVILGLTVMSLRSRLEDYWDNMEITAREFTALARRSEVTDEYLVEFSQIRETLDQLRGRITSHAAEVRLQTEEIRSGLSQLAEVKGQFHTFLEDLRGEQSKILEEFKSVYEIISPKQTASELEAAIQRSMHEVSSSFQVSLAEGRKELDRYDQSLEGFRDTLEDLRRNSHEAALDLDKSRLQLETGSKEVGEQMRRMIELQGDLLQRLDETSRLDVSKIADDLSELVGETERSMDRRVSSFLSRFERQLSQHQRVQHKTNTLLKVLVERPTFFHSVLVQPVLRMRSLFVKRRSDG